MDTNKQYTIVEVLIDDRKVICVSSLENPEAGDFAEIRFKNTNKFAQAKIISVFRNCEINNNFNTDLNVSIIRKLTDDEILITQNHLLSNKSGTKIFKYTGSKLSYFVDDNGVMNQRLEGEFLKKITIPESVIEISEGAFKEARVLEEISLNEGLEVIGDYAFEYTNIKEVTIPNSVRYIGFKAFTYFRDLNKDFYYCHAKTIVSSENRYYRSDKACVYRINGDGSEELMYCFKPGIMNFEVPKCVVSINENAFMGCKNLVNIVMNEGLKFIGKNAFNDCSIKKVYIPDTVEYLGNLPLKQDKYNNPIKIVFSSENKHFFFENDILYQYIDGGYKLICCRSVKNTVEVKEGTLTIGEGAFSLCSNLKKVLVPYTLKELERESFKSCRKLRTVTINDEEHRNLNNVICLPDAVKRIEAQTFAFTGFRSLSFSDNIEFIGEHAFCYCSSLKNVRLPKNLIVLSYEQTTPELYESEEVTDENRWMVNDDDIGKNAFSECCKLKSFKISSQNPVYKTMRGILFNKKMTEIILVPQAYSSECYVIPDTVERIGTAFSFNSGIKKVVIGKGIKKLENDSFSPCYISEFDIPSNVTEIGAYAFDTLRFKTVLGESGSYAEKYFSAIGKKHRHKFFFIDKNADPEIVRLRTSFSYDLTDDGITVWKYLKNEEEVIVPRFIEGRQVTEIGENAFSDKSNIKKVILPVGLKRIRDNAFHNCKNIEELTIPDTVEEIGQFVICRFNNMTQIHLPKSLKIITPHMIIWCEKISEIYISDGVEEICEDAFSCLGGLRRIYIPDSVVKIEDWALCNFSSEYKVEFFVNRGSYADVFLQKKRANIKYINEANELIQDDTVDLSLFDYYTINNLGQNSNNAEMCICKAQPDRNGNIRIPNIIDSKRVTKVQINDYSLRGKEIEELYIPQNVESLYFPYNVSTVVVSENNQKFTTDGYGVYSKDKKIFYRLYNRKLTSYKVCEGTEVIAKNAFENCSVLSEVTFPESLTAIEEFVFKFCRNLKLVKGGKNVVSIGNEAFNDTSFYSEANFVIVGKVLVRCNIDSRKIIIPDKVEYIAPYAVAGDEYGWNENDFVTEIVVHQSVKKIGQGAFAYRRKLSKINLPEGIEEIPSYLFVKCNSLKTIFIPSTVRRIQIENASFPEKDSFTAVFPIDFDKPEFERFIVDKRNLYFKSVDGILFSKDGSSVLAVPPKCPIDSFIIPNEVKTIKKGAFQYNKTIKTLTFTNGNINVEYCDVESGTFMGSNITEVIFPENMKKIQCKMFYGCGELRKVVLPKNLTEIEDNAFYRTQIDRLDLPSSLKRIGDTAFGFCKIDQLVLPDDLEYIEDYAFACNNIKRVVLPKALKKLGFCAFAGAEEIEIYDTLLCSEEMKTEILNILGYIGFYKSNRDMSMSSNYDKWFDYTLTVRSSDTGKTKFKIYMCSTGEKKSVYKQLPNLWSTSDSFDFIGYDSLFENLKSLDNKVKIAMYRIDYPYNLTDENRKMYQSFFKKNGYNIVCKLIDEDNLSEIIMLEKYCVITRRNIDKLIAYANKSPNNRAADYLIKYKTEEFK